MKPALLTIAFAAFFSACSKPTADAPPVPDPTPAPAPVAVATPAPAPTATPEPVAQTVPAPELAPAGVFYLLQAARIETDSGVTGLPPGTGVKFLHDDLYLTPAGEAHLQPEQLTNDLSLARAARDADRNLQAALRTNGSEQAKEVAAAEAARLAQSATAQTAEQNSKQAGDVKDRISALTAAKHALQEKLTVLHKQQSGETYRANTQGHIIASSTVAESKALVDQIAAIDYQLAQLKRR